MFFMKTGSGKKIVAISKIILKTLLGIGVAVSIITLPGLAHILKLFEEDKKYKRKFDKEIYRLKKTGFIKIYDRSGINFVKLTKEGQKVAKKYEIDDIKIKKTPKWDGKWRIVVFDIPEDKKYARKGLRIKLNDLGFLLYQKSVFVHPYECKDEINFVANYYNIKKYLKYITADAIEDQENLIRYFNLRQHI